MTIVTITFLHYISYHPLLFSTPSREVFKYHAPAFISNLASLIRYLFDVCVILGAGVYKANYIPDILISLRVLFANLPGGPAFNHENSMLVTTLPIKFKKTKHVYSIYSLLRLKKKRVFGVWKDKTTQKVIPEIQYNKSTSIGFVHKVFLLANSTTERRLAKRKQVKSKKRIGISIK